MRKTASRLITSGVMAAALALGLTASAVAAAPAAFASPACHGTSCIGHDPMVYGCAVSAAPQPVADSYGTVWIKFSNNCDSKWAQGQLTPQSLQNGYTMQIAIETSDNNEYMCVPGPSDTGSMKEYCTGYDKAPTVGWTDMVYGHLQATAVVTVWNPPKNHVLDVLQVTF